jgi:Domain of unknown function (DUF4169)
MLWLSWNSSKFHHLTRLDRRQTSTTSSAMTEIVNLKNARKQKARAEAEAKASQNRAAFGRTKTDKKSAKAETEAAIKRIEGHKRDPREQDG